MKTWFCFLFICWCCAATEAQRVSTRLDDNWLTIAGDMHTLPASQYAAIAIETKNWKKVSVPHNWDGYEGYRRLLHGNRHGEAWYRRSLRIGQSLKNKRALLFFEGAGSYATVYLNGKQIGYHAGGRTSFTIDITEVVKKDNQENILTVYTGHPGNIRDLPWVCGGCSEERGFSEGSQPMGIFRPVHLVITSDISFAPFGIHAWSGDEVSKEKAVLRVRTSFKNKAATNRKVTLVTRLVNQEGKIITTTSSQHSVNPLDSIDVDQQPVMVTAPRLWSPADPYLYKIISELRDEKEVLDKIETDYGFRKIKWDSSTHRFFINDQPLFINGVAEYEHLIGQSHAFSDLQVEARMRWLQSAGFNAFRDGHQPHNLRYGQWCNRMGVLWWTQLSAHVWFDSPAFRENFKTLLKEWVIERRNDPAVILWGLQNESKLPEDFARECTELIRSLDPTASVQRLVTTCNGGSGTDWDVPQNWTGTYGGDPATYANDLKRQVLVGEYGAWRTIDLHTEGPFVQNGPLSEDRMTQLMEQKVRLAESAKDSLAGHFFWLLTSHDNPGRVQGGEGWRELDRIGPVNYKGLLTPWEEPLDVYYMYRSNYADPVTQPMVYIVSHTWPGRWTKPGVKNGIAVYSNCSEVELFNDLDNASLGKRKRDGIGTHFTWDDVNIQYNVLYAVGYRDGRPVARDTIVLNHLPQAPGLKKFYEKQPDITTPQKGYHYWYRVNAGGPAYIDKLGQRWMADQVWEGKGIWGSQSWTKQFPGLPDFFASQRRTFVPLKGTKDPELFSTFRYGRDELEYHFPAPTGEYSIELYFTEPWLGIGGGIDAKGMRVFDVAVNGKVVLKDLDIWKEAGSNKVLRKIITARSANSELIISFPGLAAGQAVISAIAIASKKPLNLGVRELSLAGIYSPADVTTEHWLDIGQQVFTNSSVSFNALPPAVFGAQWIKPASAGPQNYYFSVTKPTDVYIAIDTLKMAKDEWKEFENTQTFLETDENGGKSYTLYRHRLRATRMLKLNNVTGPVILVPVSTMQPAFDLKKTIPYRAEKAILSTGVAMETFGGRNCAVVKSNDPVKIEWTIETGVADVYALTFKYYSSNEKGIKGRMEIRDAGNTLLVNKEVELDFTRPGKWNQFTFDTGTQINAGTYKVIFHVSGAAGVAVSGIEIQ